MTPDLDTAPVLAATAAPSPGASLTELRRYLHRHPEVGLDLPHTQATILRQLEGLELDEVRTGERLSSVIGVLHGANPGPTILLRADMDALPIRERTGEPFASTNGAMHACGHDLHMAGLVGAVRRLVARRAEIAGSIVFAFQPGEEGHGGGRLMIEEGVLEVTGSTPIACFALHVWPTVALGMFQTRPGAVMAGLNTLEVTVTGEGGHASSPHLTRDPVPVLSETVLALQTFVTRRIDVNDPVVLSVTRLAADAGALNVVPEQAQLGASVRTLSPASNGLLADELPGTISAIARAHGCSAETTYSSVYPVTVNTAGPTARAADALRSRFGEDRVELLDRPLMASEDFAFFLERVPGAFILVGACPPDADPLDAATPHSPTVIFDDAVLEDQAAAFEALALNALAPCPPESR